MIKSSLLWGGKVTHSILFNVPKRSLNLDQFPSKKKFFVQVKPPIQVHSNHRIHLINHFFIVLHTNNSSVGGGNDLLGSRGQFDSGFLGLWVVRDHGGVVSGGTSQLPTVTRLLLQTADDGTLRHDTNRQHIANVQLGYKSRGFQCDFKQHLDNTPVYARAAKGLKHQVK